MNIKLIAMLATSVALIMIGIYLMWKGKKKTLNVLGAGLFVFSSYFLFLTYQVNNDLDNGVEYKKEFIVYDKEIRSSTLKDMIYVLEVGKSKEKTKKVVVDGSVFETYKKGDGVNQRDLYPNQ